HESILLRGDRRVHPPTSATRGLGLRGIWPARSQAWTTSGVGGIPLGRGWAGSGGVGDDGVFEDGATGGAVAGATFEHAGIGHGLEVAASGDPGDAETFGHLGGGLSRILTEECPDLRL